MSARRPGARGGGRRGDDDRDLLAAAYAVGALEGAERSEAEALVGLDPRFAARVAELEQAVAALGSAVPTTPPPALRRRVMAALDDVEQLPPLDPAQPGRAEAGGAEAGGAEAGPAGAGRGERHLAAVPRADEAGRLGPDDAEHRRPVLAVLVAAVMAAVFAGAAIGGWQLLQPRAQQQEVAGALDRIEAAPDAVRATASADSPEPWSGTQLVYSRSQGEGVLTAEEPLPELDDRVYQLWRLDDQGRPVAAGAFTEGAGAVVEGGVREAAAVAVTVEEEEGLDAPTTPIVAVYDLDA